MQSTEQKTVTIDARHTFTDAEMSALGSHASRAHREHQRTEEEMKSAAKDWKAKLDRIALERDGVLRKLGDGFEMRPQKAIMIFHVPSSGRKSFYIAVNTISGDFPGELIREEAMEATDFQRDLPLEEPAKEPRKCPHGSVIAEDGGPGCVECMEDAQAIDPERFPEKGDSAKEVAEAREIIAEAGQAIGTSIGDLLDKAAQGKRPNPVVIDFSGKDSCSKVQAKWRHAARKQGWPEACIDLIDGIANTAFIDGKHGHGKQAVLDVLNAHSISVANDAQKAHEAESRSADTADMENERLAGTFGTSEDGQ